MKSYDVWFVCKGSFEFECMSFGDVGCYEIYVIHMNDRRVMMFTNEAWKISALMYLCGGMLPLNFYI